jgi:hypothetical protein
MSDPSLLINLIDQMLQFVKDHGYDSRSERDFSALSENEKAELFLLDARLGVAAMKAELTLPGPEGNNPDGGFLPKSGLRYVDKFPHRGFHIFPTSTWLAEMMALRQLAFEKTSREPSPTIAAKSWNEGSRRGRKPDSDPEADEQVWDAWNSGEHKDYEQLGHALGKAKGEIERALDRHRKRIKKGRKPVSE